MMGAKGVSPQSAGAGGRLELRVPARSESIAEVRRSLEAIAIPPMLVEDAKLLLSELVTNSIRHSGLGADDYVQITADWFGARLRVTVHDRPPSTAPASIAATIRPVAGAASGWGLFLVDRLASRWGTDEVGYWFELDTELPDGAR
jgi:anti-sigma regulatory factor (Ser/Thr protein kinase)